MSPICAEDTFECVRISAYVCVPERVRGKLCTQSTDYIEKLPFEWKTRARKMVWHKYNTAKYLCARTELLKLSAPLCANMLYTRGVRITYACARDNY